MLVVLYYKVQTLKKKAEGRQWMIRSANAGYDAAQDYDFDDDDEDDA